VGAGVVAAGAAAGAAAAAAGSTGFGRCAPGGADGGAAGPDFVSDILGFESFFAVGFGGSSRGFVWEPVLQPPASASTAREGDRDESHGGPPG
jgi:hypothetical protein